jgi:hypothetical protein
MKPDFIEGVLRHDWNIEGKYITLEYQIKYGGYFIRCGMSILSKCQNLEEGEIVFDTMCMSEIINGKYLEVARAAKKEHRRLIPLCSIRGMEYDTPARRHNEAVYGALRRLEGLRPQVHKGFTKWIPV